MPAMAALAALAALAETRVPAAPAAAAEVVSLAGATVVQVVPAAWEVPVGKVVAVREGRASVW